MPAFLLKNPLASIMGVGAIVLAILLGVQTFRLALQETATAKAEKATEAAKLEFADFKKDLAIATANAERDAARRSADEAKQLLEDFKNFRDLAVKPTEIITNVKGDPNCDRDPRVPVIIDSVRNFLEAAQGNPGGGPGKAGPGATATVRPAPSP